MKTIFDSFPVLHTGRLTLRKIMPGDEDAIYFLRSDPGMMRYTGQALAQSVDEIRTYVRRYEEITDKGEGMIWAISYRNSTELIGLISFRKFYPQHFRGEVGYGIHPAHQGLGLMGEALTEVVQFGFNRIGLHSIEANVDKENVASIRLLESAGFVKEAHFRENYFFENKFIDSVIYSLVDHSKMPGYYVAL